MYRVGTHGDARSDDGFDIEIRLRGRSRPDAARVLHELQVVRVGVGFGIDAERNDTHLACAARDANRDFAAVGDQ